MNRYRGALVCILLLLGTGSAQAISKRALEQRIVRLERLIEQQSEMFLQLQQLQQEIRSIRGELEVHGHTLDTIQRRQREIYRDLDERIGKLERASAPDSGAGTAREQDGAGPEKEQEIIAAEQEQQLYQQAFAHLRKLEYPKAVTAFTRYLKSYPEGSYAAKAQYWLGEIRYVRGAYKQAIAAYRKLIENYPDSSKLPEAMLKIGLSYRELGKRSAANKQLAALVARFPDSPEAEEARKYLKK